MSKQQIQITTPDETGTIGVDYELDYNVERASIWAMIEEENIEENFTVYVKETKKFYAYEFKNDGKWHERDLCPDVKEEELIELIKKVLNIPTNNHKQYLTVNNGELTWSNDLIPASSTETCNIILEEHETFYVPLKYVDTDTVFLCGMRYFKEILDVTADGESMVINLPDKLNGTYTVLKISNSPANTLDAINNEYVKRNELNRLQVGNEHNHDDLAKAQHSHKNYITKAEVLALVYDNVGVQLSKGQLSQLTSEIIKEYKEDVESIKSIINGLKTQNTDASNITFDNSYNLEEVIKVSLEKSDAKNIILENVKIELGEDYDGFYEEITLEDYIKKTSVRCIAPELLEPTLDIDVKNVDFEKHVYIKYNQNHAGVSTAIYCEDNLGVRHYVNLYGYVVVPRDRTYKVVCEYEEGRTYSDNLGSNIYQIQKGTIEVKEEFDPQSLIDRINDLSYKLMEMKIKLG